MEKRIMILILISCIIKIKPFLYSRNKFILFSEVNQVLLKVKGIGKVNIFYSNSKCKPTSFYLNNNTTPYLINSAKIDLPNSDNEVKLIFENSPATNCFSMFKGCSNIIEIDLSYFNTSNNKILVAYFMGVPL